MLKATLLFRPTITCRHATTLHTDQEARRRFGELQCHLTVMLQPNMNLNMMGKWVVVCGGCLDLVAPVEKQSNAWEEDILLPGKFKGLCVPSRTKTCVLFG